MAKYERILLATDFSDQANTAQAEAVRLARKHAAELHLLYVDVIALQGVGAFQDPVLPDYVRNVEQVSMHAYPGAVPPNYDRTVFKICRDSSEAAGILRYAAEIKADLIVVGTHGRSAVSELIVGSVAQAVARTAPVSVMIVGSRDRAEHPRGAGVLAPVDFSAGSLDALAHAGRVAGREAVPLMALHVVNFDRVDHPEELEIGERERRGRAELERFVKTAQLPVVAEKLVTVGPAAEVIVRIAEAHDAGLIVMAPSKHTTLEQFMLLGSVTKAVIRHATCPVLIYRQPGERAQARAAA